MEIGLKLGFNIIRVFYYWTLNKENSSNKDAEGIAMAYQHSISSKPE